MDCVIIKDLNIYRYSLDLHRPLIVRGLKVHQRQGFILRIKSDSGHDGFGEVAPLLGFSQESLAEAADQLKVLPLSLRGQEIPDQVERLDGKFEAWLGGYNLKPSIRFGLESAVLNLIAHTRKATIQTLISDIPRSQINIAGLLVDSGEPLSQQAKNLVDLGFKELKFKVGGEVSFAVEQTRAVADIIRERAILHVDANQAWDYTQALEFSKGVGCAAISYIEEPFANIEKIPEFFDETLIPVALDESVSAMTFDEIKSISGVDFIVLKPTMLGGIERTFQMLRQAEQSAIHAIISSSFESSLGIGILGQLSVTVSHPISAGLDTLKWFQADTLNCPITIDGGKMVFPDYPIGESDINFDVLEPIE